MSERREIEVHYIACPSITEGRLSFKENSKSPLCVCPSYPYLGGRYHIGKQSDEVDQLARSLGIETREEFARNYEGPWKRAYITVFTDALGERLMNGGFDWTYYPEDGGEPKEIRFICPPGEFERTKT